MNIPVRLTRNLESRSRADAILIVSNDLASLAHVISQRSRTITIYQVANGFLLVGESANDAAGVGAIRLRKLAGQAYVPIDADLIPSLLPGELTDLTKIHGLVFLPGDHVYSFDSNKPLEPRDWLTTAPIRRKDWQPLPAKPELPDRLTRIEFPTPPAAVVEILNDGKPDGSRPLPSAGESGDGIEESDRPPSASIGKRILAGAAMAAAGTLVAIGKLLNAPNLAKKGAELARRAMESVPRISERVLGEQEAALRDVLRQLKSGDAEKALRKAPIAVADPDQPSQIAGSSRLSDRDVRFSLRDLISGGSGGASTWLGGGDVWLQLANEYRRLAIEAIQKGDYRRAAYLYGVLLRDVRSAAAALEQGGLHREAAILYRDKLHDTMKAATAFEKAGDSDEAIRLYEKIQHYELAGDLARRIGDDDRAIWLYSKASEQCVADKQYLKAGDLVRTKIGNQAEAMALYRTGWDKGRFDSLACGMWVLIGHLGERDWKAAHHFLDEAEGVLAPPQLKEAEAFYNRVRIVIKDIVPKEFRDDFDDRRRLFFATHLRASPHDPSQAKALFNSTAKWSSAVTRDAIAATTQKGTPKPITPLGKAFRVVEGVVRHVAVSQSSRDLVVATDTEIVIWSPTTLVRKSISLKPTESIIGLVVNDQATSVVALFDRGNDLSLARFVDTGESNLIRRGVQVITRDDHVNISEVSLRSNFDDSLNDVRVYIRDRSFHFQGSELYPLPQHNSVDLLSIELITHVINQTTQWEWCNGQVYRLAIYDTNLVDSQSLGRPGWAPRKINSNYSQFDWMAIGETSLILAGIDHEGELHWTSCQIDGDPKMKSATGMTSVGYVAACLLGPDLIAAVDTNNLIHWLRLYGRSFQPFAKSTELNDANPLFTIIDRASANEVIAIFVDGSVIRIPRP